jgi:hypothetical protein
MTYNVGDLFVFQSKDYSVTLTMISLKGDCCDIEWRNAKGHIEMLPYSCSMLDSFIRQGHWNHYPVKT